MNDRLIQRLCTLSQPIAPSGAEHVLLAQIHDIVAPFCDRIERDALGNLLCFRDGQVSSLRPLLLSAHADEVGLMITEITEDGSLTFSCIGGIDESILCGKTVTLLGHGTQVHGVIFDKPLHLMPRTERTQRPKLESLCIDIGADSKATAETMVDIGDFGVLDGAFVRFGNSLCTGKALDDRLGCAILCELLQTLSERNIRTRYPLCIAFTVREEIGLSGAVVAANRVRPSHAIVLETTAIADIPNVMTEKQVAEVGKGGVLSMADRSTVYDRAFVQAFLDVAKRQNIPAQVKKFVSGGNDAGHIHKSGSGVKCVALSAPCRYLHSPSCVLDLKDACAMFDLVLAVLQDSTMETKMEESQ